MNIAAFNVLISFFRYQSIDSDALSNVDEVEVSMFSDHEVIKLECADSDDQFSDDDRPLDRLAIINVDPPEKPSKRPRGMEIRARLIRPIKTSHFTKPIHCSVITQTKQVLRKVSL